MALRGHACATIEKMSASRFTTNYLRFFWPELMCVPCSIGMSSPRVELSAFPANNACCFETRSNKSHFICGLQTAMP